MYENYYDVQRELSRLQNNLEQMKNAQRIIENTRLSESEKTAQKDKLQSNMDDITRQINGLLPIQKAHDTIINNLKAIKEFDLTSALYLESEAIKLDNLRKEIIEARKVLPASMLKEILESSGIEMSSEEFEKTIKLQSERSEDEKRIDFKSEYDKLSKEFDNVLGGKSLSEIGTIDLGGVLNKYTEIKGKKDKLKEAFDRAKSTNPALFTEDDLKAIESLEHAFDEKANLGIKSVKEEQDLKESMKKSISEEIDKIKANIANADKQITELENEIRELLKGASVDRSVIEAKRSTINDIKKYISGRKDKITELEGHIKTLTNGGKIDFEKIKSEFEVKAEEIKPVTPTVEEEARRTPPSGPGTSTAAPGTSTAGPGTSTAAPGTPPSGPGTSTSGPEGRKTPPAPKTPVIRNIETLIKEGILPNNLYKSEMLYICAELGINVKDYATALTPEQIDRLKNDHQIQTALLNQRIFERNKKKISEYDKLINKYESILNEKMNGKAFSPEYITKVELLLEKLRTEKRILVARNKAITAVDRSEILRGSSITQDERLDGRALTQNDKLRKQYSRLDDLREQKEAYSSKFKKKRIEKKIQKTLDRISKLKTKKGTIASKQTQIVTKNSDKYIERMARKIDRHVSKQIRVEHRVDRINDISERIDIAHAEAARVAMDRTHETRLLDRIGLAIEDRHLQSQASRLEAQRDFEDFVGRGR